MASGAVPAPVGRGQSGRRRTLSHRRAIPESEHNAEAGGAIVSLSADEDKQEHGVEGRPADVRHRPGEPISALVARVRAARGMSQLALAQRLCAVSGMPTVSRHEVSRWERGVRVPAKFWLRWLAVALAVPSADLDAAVQASRTGARRALGDQSEQPFPMTLWRPPRAAELHAALAPGADAEDLPELAHQWLAGPCSPVTSRSLVARPADDTDPLNLLADRLPRLRRADDLVGGVDLSDLADRHLRAAIDALPSDRDTDRHRRGLGLVARYAQLAGWVCGDAHDPAGAYRRFRVALWAASAAQDQLFAAHVLGCVSHQRLHDGATAQALLFARTAQAGVRDRDCAATRALLAHRVALAAAHIGQRRVAHAALAAAGRSAAHLAAEQTPPWLYWLDAHELRLMTGRCLAAMGRPLRATRYLTSVRGRGPRAAALYGACLARSYLALGEYEQASRLARRVLHDALRSGSARAANGLHQLRPLLRQHRDLTAVRGFDALATSLISYLPTSADSAAAPVRAETPHTVRP